MHESLKQITVHPDYIRLQAAGEFENVDVDYPITKERRWVISIGRPWPKHLAEGTYMYVVMPAPIPEIRIPEFPRPRSRIHHPELANGKSVIAAGIIKVNETVWYIDNESGHYNPDEYSVYIAVAAFRLWGIPLSSDLQISTRWSHFG